jgi:hypothetical protein
MRQDSQMAHEQREGGGGILKAGEEQKHSQESPKGERKRWRTVLLEVQRVWNTLTIEFGRDRWEGRVRNGERIVGREKIK